MATIGIVVVALLSIFLRGFVLTILWGWFISQPFGVRPISIPIAMGLSLLVGLFGSHDRPGDARTWEVQLTAALTVSALALLCGFLWHLAV